MFSFTITLPDAASQPFEAQDIYETPDGVVITTDRGFSLKISPELIGELASRYNETMVHYFKALEAHQDSLIEQSDFFWPQKYL